MKNSRATPAFDALCKHTDGLGRSLASRLGAPIEQRLSFFDRSKEAIDLARAEVATLVAEIDVLRAELDKLNADKRGRA